jgi:hypothetical protein
MQSTNSLNFRKAEYKVGDAVVGDVTSGKKFYKDDADTELTGTAKFPSILVSTLLGAGKTSRSCLGSREDQ